MSEDSGFDSKAYLAGRSQPVQSKPSSTPEPEFNPSAYLNGSSTRNQSLLSDATPDFDPTSYLSGSTSQKAEDLISRGAGQRTEMVQVGVDGTFGGMQSPVKQTMPLPKDMPPAQTLMQARPGAIPEGQGSKVLVTLVKDGDTFDFDPRGSNTVPNAVPDPGNGKYTCRIDSIDTPETSHGPNKPGQSSGKEAGEALRKMIENKEVTVRIARSDKHGRNVCQVEIEGVGVDHELVKNGLAWVVENARQFDDTARLDDLRALQRDALRNQTGMFGPDFPGGTWEPSRWRKQKWVDSQ